VWFVLAASIISSTWKIIHCKKKNKKDIGIRFDHLYSSTVSSVAIDIVRVSN